MPRWNNRAMASYVQILIGSLMLGVAVSIFFIWSINQIGIKETLAAFILCPLVVAWLVTGVVLLAKGISKRR